MINYYKYALNIEDVEIFEDAGYSGKNTDRPAYQRMMATVLINSRIRNFAQLEAYRHAIAHIMNHDFDKPDADAIEAVAHEG